MRAGNKGRTIEQVVVGLLQGEEEGSHRLPSTSADTASSRDDFARLLDEPHISSKSAGRNGIAVFRGGIKEVENTVIEIKRLLKEDGIHHVEVVGIHGSTPSDERRAARLPPKPGWRKIIVGTNVIESGVNLLWVDAGVSDGVRKVPHHRADTGANTLVSQELPQTGITQQMGRINRNPEATGFANGIFILHAKNRFEQRPTQSGPAIERESMLAPAFHAASLGYKPTLPTLTWDISESHASGLPARLEQARQELLRLELIHDDWSLSDQGEFINHLPVSPETGAMLNEAHRIDEQRLRSGKPARVLRDAVILAAIGEGRNLKINSKANHRGDQHHTSDNIDAMNAYRAIVAQASRSEILAPVLRKNDENYLATATPDQLAKLQGQRAKLEQLCTEHNMTVQGFIQTAQLVAEISSRLEKHGVKLHAPVTDEKYDAARYDELKRCILNGRVNQLFQFEQGGLRDLLRDYGNGRSDKGLPFSGYEIAESSIVNSRPPEGTLIVGDLREVLPKGKAGKLPDDASPSKKKRKNACDEAAGPLLVVSNATVIPPHVFIAWAKDRAERSTSLDSIVTDGHLSPDGKLHANYAGKARFELPVPHTAMIDAGYLATEHHGPNFSGGDGKKSKRKKGDNKGPWVNEVRDSKQNGWLVK
jgi:riboflavin synthase